MCIVKIPVQAGSLQLQCLIDTCAPCSLIKHDIARELVRQDVAKWQGDKRYGTMALRSLNGVPLQLGPEISLSFNVGGETTSAELLTVHDCQEDMLLATDFCVNNGVLVDLRKEMSCIHFHNLAVTVPFHGSFRQVPAERMPQTLLFLNETSFTIDPFCESLVEVRHLLSDPLSSVSRDVLVSQYLNAPMMNFVIRDAVVHLENGIGTVLVVNPTANPVFFDECSVIAVATSICAHSDKDVEELAPHTFDSSEPVASLALSNPTEF